MNRGVTLALFFLLAAASKAQTENDNLSNLGGFDGEPSIAINPTNPNNLIAGWMRLRLDGKIWIAVRATFDGGVTWSPLQFLPHVQPDFGSADVSIAFHRSGVAYLSYVDYKTATDTAGGIYLVHSTDGGVSWSAPKEIVNMRDRPDLPVDRPWIAVDNSGGANDGRVYNCSFSANWYPGQHHIYIRSTTDRGVTWSALHQIDDQTYSVGIVKKSYAALSVGADGRIYTTYISYDTLASPLLRLYSATSSDAGVTWRRSVLTNVFLTLANLSFTRGYAIAADPIRNDRAIAVWIDERFGDSDVLMKRTSDGGQTWSLPVRINDDSSGIGIGQDLVWIQYSPQGNAAIVWRDRRLGGVGLSSPVDVYASLSSDGGQTFGMNGRLSSSTSPFVVLSCCNSFLGIAMNEKNLFTVWSDYRSNDWEVYFQKNSAPVSVRQNAEARGGDFTLSQNHPNPFSESTTIFLPLLSGEGARRADEVSLKLFDLFGREVLDLTNRIQSASSITIHRPDLPAPGMYFYRLQSGEQTVTKKLLLMK